MNKLNIFLTIYSKLEKEFTPEKAWDISQALTEELIEIEKNNA